MVQGVDNADEIADELPTEQALAQQAAHIEQQAASFKQKLRVKHRFKGKNNRLLNQSNMIMNKCPILQ